jgi:hypothetical protein
MMSYHHFNLTEGLRPLDLEHMVYPSFEIDTYRSKMGEDQDVCVLSFQLKDRSPAKDLMDFIEKGFHYVLDADVSAGESNAGDYYVFVELPRESHLGKHISDILYGISKLTGIMEFTFKYHVNDSLYDATKESLESIVPSSPAAYVDKMRMVRTEGVRKFFSKTLMDDFTLDGDVITISKPFGNKIKLQLVQENAILEGTTGYALDETTMSEIFWLTKVLGDYTINKIGENFVFLNNDNAMLLKRID